VAPSDSIVVHYILPTDEMDFGDEETTFNAVVIHELGYILGRYRPYKEREKSDQAAISAEVICMAEKINGPHTVDLQIIPFIGHGANIFCMQLKLVSYIQ
jgi:hypothetical protein